MLNLRLRRVLRDFFPSHKSSRDFHDPIRETMETFSEDSKYQDKIVAFVDVMGVKDRIVKSDKPQDFEMYTTILNMFANQPFAEGKLHISMFSDCMYIVANKEHIDLVINLLANFSYRLLFNNIPLITVNPDGSILNENCFDCFKLRGGITFGKVFSIDEEAQKKGAVLHTNALFGQGIVDAYTLESKFAVYPRIIVDDKFLTLMKEQEKTIADYYLRRDENEKCYYVDFLDYMCAGKRENAERVLNGLDECISFVAAELNKALSAGNARLSGQLLWYKQYLEAHQAIQVPSKEEKIK